MAESMDDVRGMERRSGRMVLLVKGVEAVRTGDAGGELPRGWERGSGEEILRSWWYEPVFTGALAGLMVVPRSLELGSVSSLTDASEAASSSRRSLGDFS